jgi:hypothetical protein
MDFRRSGSAEGIAGKVAPKMANTIDQNKELQATYLPISVVRLADVARVEARRRLRGENKSRPKS